MRVRATKDLSQLDDSALFAKVAEGLGLIVKHVDRLTAGAATLLQSNQTHAARVLCVLAEEEAAKFLVLLDAVRCPRKPPKLFADQLGRFNDHLAKGIYARASGMRPVTLAQLQEYVDNLRDSHYLDGPNDVDWIFRNEIIEGREGLLYVDFVVHDDGARWSVPCEFEDLLSAIPQSHCVQTIQNLHAAGIANAEGLAAVADVWRSEALTPETHVRDVWGCIPYLLSGGVTVCVAV